MLLRTFLNEGKQLELGHILRISLKDKGELHKCKEDVYNIKHQ